MFRIGAFSKITNTTIRTLHHYEDLGLFLPYKHDELTGYRYYSSHQIKDLNRIKVLQEVGFSLAEIKEISSSHDQGFVENKLESRRNKLQEDIIEMEAKLQLLNSMSYEKNSFEKYHVSVKEIPARNVISIRKNVENYYDEASLWEELYDKTTDNSVVFSDPYQCMTIYHDKEFKLKQIDIEVQVSIDVSKTSLNENVYQYEPSFKMVSTVFAGDYNQMNLVCEVLAEWAEHHGLELSGVMVNIPIVSPAQSENANEWITEAGYIITEKE